MTSDTPLSPTPRSAPRRAQRPAATPDAPTTAPASRAAAAPAQVSRPATAPTTPTQGAAAAPARAPRSADAPATTKPGSATNRASAVDSTPAARTAAAVGKPAAKAPTPARTQPARTQPAAPAAATSTPQPSGVVVSFADLGVPAPLVASLAQRGITEPFPIQTATLVDTLAGRDVLGRGRTGSGKTLAFALPLVTRLAGSSTKRRPNRPRGLVLAPTRELANQIAETVEPLAAALGLRVTTIFGGVPQGRQVAALASGIDVVVATPGRLEDLKGQGFLYLTDVEVTVLDEADHMADLGFLPGVKRILDATPPRGQRMLFSATLDNGVDVLVRRYLSDPLTHSVDPATSAVSTMTHHIFEVATAAEKTDLVHRLASGTSRRLLFSRTKHRARTLARQLTAAGIPAVDLHGNLSQNARERNLAAFSSGEVRVLVATDIAARGIHVDDVELVVHVDPPTEHKAYLHRSGRTARAGSGGAVVTVMLPEERADVRQLTRAAQISATPQPVLATSAAVTDLVGDVAAHVDPANAPEAAARKPEPQPARKPRPAGQAGSGRAGSGRAATARTSSSARQPQAGRSSGSRSSGSAAAYSTSSFSSSSGRGGQGRRGR